MVFNHSQKKYLKKSLKKIGLRKAAENLKVSEKEILHYLKNIWPKDKYQKFLKEQGQTNIFQEKTLPISKTEDKISNFTFKKFFKNNWKILAFLTFLVLATYANGLNNSFLSDDFPAIRDNQNLGHPFYYLHNPVNFSRYFLYFLAYKIGGLNPIFYRLINVFFHLGSVFLILGIISLLANPFLGFLTASLFAVHPIESESITWISAGPHAQYSFFLLFSFLLYLLARQRQKPLKIYVISLVSFLLALTTTEKSIILPFILLFFEIAFGVVKRNWQKLIPYFGLSFFWGIMILSLGNLSQRITALENQYYQKVGFENPFVQIPVALSSYLRLIFWPDKLALYHSELNFTQQQYFLMVATTFAFLALIAWGYKKNRQIFFWGSFFIIALLPMLTPLRVGWVVAERYVYLGSIGIIFLIAWVIDKIGKITKKKFVTLIIFAILVLGLSTRTIIRNFDWKNQDTLWLAGAKTSPSSHQNYNNLGDLYARRGEYEKAIEEFKKAIELKPDYGDAYHNLANIYHQINRDDLAKENYKKALKFNPNLWQSYQNLAAIYFIQKNFNLAKEFMEKALKINPENIDLHINSGILYLNIKDEQKAKEEFEKALQIDPQNEKAQQLLNSLNK